MLPELSKFKHKTMISVRYSDLDTLQHVNNSRYLSYLEEARLDYCFEVLNISRNTSEIGSIVARVEISYHAPIVFSDKVELYTRCSKIGNKSVEFETFVVKIPFGEDVQIIAAKSVTTIVSYDFKAGKSIANLPELMQKIRNFEENPSL